MLPSRCHLLSKRSMHHLTDDHRNQVLQSCIYVAHSVEVFPGDLVLTVCLQCRRLGFDPWVRKTSWRKEWLPPPAFLPGEFHGQRSLAGHSPWVCKELDTTTLTLSLFHILVYQTNKYHKLSVLKAIAMYFLRFWRLQRSTSRCGQILCPVKAHFLVSFLCSLAGQERCWIFLKPLLWGHWSYLWRLYLHDLNTPQRPSSSDTITLDFNVWICWEGRRHKRSDPWQ